MQYMTIIHELLQQRPQTHEQLRKEPQLLATVEQYAKELKSSHEAWKRMLASLTAGEPPDADRQRGPGIRPEGNGGSFAERFAGGNEARSFSTRRCSSTAPTPRALNAWRLPPSLFDAQTGNASAPLAAPSGASWATPCPALRTSQANGCVSGSSEPLPVATRER